MKISYKKLWIMLIERDIEKSILRKETQISVSTLHKMNKGEDVSLAILLRICKYLQCNIGDICDAVPTE